MSRSEPGKYYIVNRQKTSDGKSLAITYNGVNGDLTVTEMEKLPTQVWIIKDVRQSFQGFFPLGAPNLQVVRAYRPEKLTVLPGAFHYWTLTGNNGVYIIQDGDLRHFWSLREVAAGEPVYWSIDTGEKKHYWQLVTAPD